ATSTIITEVATLPVTFGSGDTLHLEFYVTKLDSECNTVLGYNWLSRYNPLIDWVEGSITFRNHAPPSSSVGSLPAPSGSDSCPDSRPSPVSKSSRARRVRKSPKPSWPYEPACTLANIPATTPQISIISAAAFVRACNEPGSERFTLFAEDPDASTVTGRSGSMEEVDLSSVPEEYHEFAQTVFSERLSWQLPPHRDHDLKIELEEGTQPPLGRIYPLSEAELKALREFLNDHLCSGFITSSGSPFGAPVLFVKKKSGALRLCVDFRGLNKITKKDRYPLPLISDLLDAPNKASVYTKLDLRHAYHLVRIAEGDEWKTAFRTRYGSYQWNVIPEGLTNAPAAFQRFVNSIFADMLDVCVVVYLDDILIFSENMDDHRKHVKEVLRRLEKHGLYCNPTKCEFHVSECEFLGYILSPDGFRMAEDKVKAITDWPAPRKVKDIQSFLGFCNFYRRFIYGYSDITHPLNRLTRKDVRWTWGPDQQSAFDTLKEAFTRAPILTHWEPDRQITVETDASDYAIAAILSITLDDGQLHPVAFLSRTLHAAELNYDTHDKELLAIFEAFKTWRHYLEGSGSPIDVHVGTSTPKEGDTGYTSINPQNLRPVFTEEQLITSLRATYLEEPVLRASILMDLDQLHKNIRTALPLDPEAVAGLKHAKRSHLRWSEDELCALLYWLWTQQTKAPSSVQTPETASGTYMGPWDSISMDFIEQLLDMNGHISILVVIDCTSKQAIFIPLPKKINSPTLA
ncbi:hypothetical protein MPER_13056, partial [Moniliophthora perniciosa FA553]